MISTVCDKCLPAEVWPHEHVGDHTLSLLIVVRDQDARKEWYFHGTQEQCQAFLTHPKGHQQERFEELLLLHKDWDKALEAFT